MGKQIYLIRQSETGNESLTDQASYEYFSKRIRQIVESLVATSRINHLSYVITEEKPPAFSVIPFGKSKIASISIKKNDADFLAECIDADGFTGAYNVEEALPVRYEKNWTEEKTPGACLLTLFRQKKGLDYESFINRWHNGHTPLSLKIHPLWHYSRNVVTGTEQSSMESFDGIVEEHTRSESELLNPLKFFGNPLVILPNMIRVYFDVKSFLDYSSVEPYLTREYIIL